jgi:hypothetical protein
MKLPFALLCMAGSIILLWIAFHDIENLLPKDAAGQPQKPTPSLIGDIVAKHFTKP